MGKKMEKRTKRGKLLFWAMAVGTLTIAVLTVFAWHYLLYAWHEIRRRHDSLRTIVAVGAVAMLMAFLVSLRVITWKRIRRS